MLNEDNVDEEYKHLIKQQIAKIQQSRAEEEKQKLLEKEKKAHQDANAYFKKIKEENIKLKKKAEREKILAKEGEEKKIQEAKGKQKVLELKIQQKLEKEVEEQEEKMNETRIEISIRKRKNTEIQSELLKIAKLDETPKPVSVKADNPTINLQQPNLHPFIGTRVNLKRQILVTIVHPAAHFMEFLALPH